MAMYCLVLVLLFVTNHCYCTPISMLAPQQDVPTSTSSGSHVQHHGTCAETSEDCPALCQCCKEGTSGLKITCREGYDPSALDTFLTNHSDLIELSIKYSDLHQIPDPVLKMSNLTLLDLSNNLIQTLSPGRLQNLTALHRLILDRNLISRLDTGCLRGLQHLGSFSMTNNKLSALAPDVFLVNLPKLVYIDLTHNALTELDTWPLVMSTFNHSNGLYPRILLDYNQISSLVNTLGLKISDIRPSYHVHVSLQYNQLKHWADFNIIKLLKVQFWMQLLVMWNMGFNVRNNSWDCGCDMYEFIKFIEPIIPLFNKSMHDTGFIQIFCETPKVNAGKLIYKMKLTDFQCQMQEGCPNDQCSCIRVPDNDTVVVSCHGLKALPKRMPRQPNIVMLLSQQNVSKLEAREYLTNVTLLDLSSNKLHSVDTEAIQQLGHQVQTLYLNQNRLRNVPKSWQNESWPMLKTLRLDDNYFQCSCNFLWLRNWLLRHQNIVQYEGDILCYDKRHHGASLVKLSEDELCGHGRMSQLVITAIGLGSVLVLIILLILLFSSTRVRRGITWCIFRHHVTKMARKDVQDDKEYDAFICYSQKDAEFVRKQLIPLEQALAPSAMKLCVHHRDFLPGQLISTNIIDSISQSRAVILVLTPDFLTSEWCLFEYEMTLAYQVKAGSRSLAVLLVFPTEEDRAELKMTKKLPKSMQHMVKKQCYLVATDEGFQQKCLNFLSDLHQPDDEDRDNMDDDDTDSLLG